MLVHSVSLWKMKEARKPRSTLENARKIVKESKGNLLI